MRPVIIKSFEELNKAELYQIIQLRIAVFIVEQDCPYPDLDGMDQDAQHLWIEDAGEIVCYLRVNQLDQDFWSHHWDGLSQRKAIEIMVMQRN